MKPSFNKMAFFKDMKYVPHNGQRRVHLATEPRRVLACGVRWGKTMAAAMEILAAAMEPREHSMGWVVGPTYELADKVFREVLLRAALHLPNWIISMKESDRRLQLRNLAGGISEIRAKSADNPMSLLGEGLDYVVIDEASQLKPSIWQNYLSQRLIDKKGWALLISTPKGKGYFFDLFRRGQGRDPEWRSWNQPSHENPLLDAELIERERQRIPERTFRQEYLAEFIEGAGAVFRNVRERATGELQEPAERGLYYAGLDLAKVEDYTVLTILDRDLNLVFEDRFHGIDWGIQVDRINAGLKRYRNPEVYVDSTGAGEPIYETLRREGVRARPYTFTQKSKDALIRNLSLMFEQRKITIPRPEIWPEGIDELEAFEYSVTESGNVRTGAPGSYHDDIVISLALAAWHHRPRPKRAIGHGPEIIYADGVDRSWY